ncbi:hypothetical protein JM81_0502 [Maribacter sp. MAR_2009_72]|nr:hypothetical protein JM81_0502 [Maribacter sp. MAR_2009_72]
MIIMFTDCIAFTHLKQQINGSRFTPKTRLRHPVLLVHGFGSNRIGVGRSFINLAQHLYNNGFEVYSFDRLGHGESEGCFEHISVYYEIEQLHAMVNYVLSKYNRKVHVLGHSLGGMEAAKLAAQRPDVIASLSLWAPAAVFAHEIAEQGVIQGKSIEGAAEKGYFDFKGQKLGYKFIEEAKGFKPYEGLDNYDQPVFIHQGEKDDVVPMEYAKKYVACWKGNSKLYTYKNADHGWNVLEERESLIHQTVTDLLDLQY